MSEYGLQWLQPLMVALSLLCCLGWIPALGALPLLRHSFRWPPQLSSHFNPCIPPSTCAAPQGSAADAHALPTQLQFVQSGYPTGTPLLLPVPQPTGMILSPALQPIPARLVQQILSGAFEEMHDLLADNRELQE